MHGTSYRGAVCFDGKTKQITHVSIIVLFHQIGLEWALSRTSGCRGNGTNAISISRTLHGHVISKCSAAATTPVVVESVAVALGALPSAVSLLMPLLVSPVVIAAVCRRSWDCKLIHGWGFKGWRACMGVALGKTTPPSVATAEQYAGRGIADSP
jgi:hypothetical protein